MMHSWQQLLSNQKMNSYLKEIGTILNHKTADGAVVYNTAVAYPVGIIAAALFLGIFLYSIKKRDVKPQYETLGK